MLHIDNIAEDPVCRPGDRPASLEELVVASGCADVYGTVLIPGGAPEETYPCAIVLHGFPGHASTFDIAQNLRRTGLVVVHFSYRGCWGSQGTYSFSGAIQDAVQVAQYLRQCDVAQTYHINPRHIFLIGHSMGGFVAVNTARRLPWIQGIALISPYDMPGFIERRQERLLYQLIDASLYVLHVGYPGALYDDAHHCYEAGYGISHAGEDLKDRNLYFIGAARDDIAPACEMIKPLWQQLCRQPTQAVRQFDQIDADHAYNDKRLTVSRMLAQWIQRVLQQFA